MPLDITAILVGYSNYIMKGMGSLVIILALTVVRNVVDGFFQKIAESLSASTKHPRLRRYIREQYVKPARHFITLVFILIAILILMGVWGLTDIFGSLLVGAGVTAVVVGFAAQGVLSDFIAGVMILLDSPFSIGEWITVGKIGGRVTDISLRSTRIKSFEGEYITIPNRKIAEDVVVNKSRRKKLMLKTVVGVDYEADVDKAIEISKKVLTTQEDILTDPEPEVIVSELAASSVNLQLRFWVKNMMQPDTLRLKSRVIRETKGRLEKAGMYVPFQHIELIQHDR